MKLIKRKIMVSRKKHECFGCGDIIKNKEPYYLESIKYDFKIINLKFCYYKCKDKILYK